MMQTIKPYRVENSALSLEDVLRKNSEDCAVIAPERLNPMGYYRGLLAALAGMQHCDIRPMREFMRPAVPGTVVIGLRHDVDHDIVAALVMSEVEAAYTLCGSYYLLHSPFTSPGYYGRYDEERGMLLRNNCLATVYRAIHNAGSEIGLHVDAAGLFMNGIDGCNAIQTELAWLRKEGLVIAGFAAHNSFIACHIENFEFFAEYNTGYADQVRLGEWNIPLGQLSAAGLGLRYEANYPSPNTRRTREAVSRYAREAQTEDVAEFLRWYLHNNPYCRWGTDYTCWLYGKDSWAIAQTSGVMDYIPKATASDVLDFIGTALEQSRIVLHVHPCYVGKRSGDAALCLE
jgi:hypothetical protein